MRLTSIVHILSPEIKTTALLESVEGNDRRKYLMIMQSLQQNAAKPGRDQTSDLITSRTRIRLSHQDRLEGRE